MNLLLTISQIQYTTDGQLISSLVGVQDKFYIFVFVYAMRLFIFYFPKKQTEPIPNRHLYINLIALKNYNSK